MLLKSILLSEIFVLDIIKIFIGYYYLIMNFDFFEFKLYFLS